MHGRTFAAIAALTCGGSALLSAQTSAYHPSASLLFTRPASAASEGASPPATYWKTGALVVGIPSAILGAAVGTGLCGLNDSAGRKSCVAPAVGTAVLFGIMGGAVGALIGGQFHKPG